MFMGWKMGAKFSKPVRVKFSCWNEVNFSCCNENLSRGTIKINILRYKKPPRLRKQEECLQGGEKHVNIRKKYVDLWFENQFTPTLHKQVRYRLKSKQDICKRCLEQFQSDLCDMSNISKFNDKYTFHF